MKIAISGKGGVGKTTLTALLARSFVDKGFPVMAVDADPAPCLADAMAFPAELREQLKPIVEMEELIAERTGTQPGTVGGFFTINPQVDDLPERFSVEYQGVRLLELGAITTGGAGCICPESAMLKSLLTYLLFSEQDVLLIDMYAGVEHLGRATIDFVDALLIVVEPTHRSLKTAEQIKKLAQDIGLKNMWLVGNKVDASDDVNFIEDNFPGLPLLGYLPLKTKFVQADRQRTAVYDFIPPLKQAALDLSSRLEMIVSQEMENIQ